jgi:hypothetical protein
MKTLPKMLTALVCILAAAPALAVTITDGTGGGIAAADLAKILSIMTPLGGDLTSLHQAAGRGNERYYCGRVQTANGPMPFLVNVIADQVYVAGSSDQDAPAKIDAFGCL